jgi:hypothetical protein
VKVRRTQCRRSDQLIQSSRYQIDRHETCRKTVCRQRANDCCGRRVNTSTLYCASRAQAVPRRTANEDIRQSQPAKTLQVCSLSSPSDRKASLKSLSNRKIFPGPDRLEEGDDYSTRSLITLDVAKHTWRKWLRFEDDNTNHDQSTISRRRGINTDQRFSKHTEKYANRELKHIRHRQDHYVDMNDRIIYQFRKTEQRWLNRFSLTASTAAL